MFIKHIFVNLLCCSFGNNQKKTMKPTKAEIKKKRAIKYSMALFYFQEIIRGKDEFITHRFIADELEELREVLK